MPATPMAGGSAAPAKPGTASSEDDAQKQRDGLKKSMEKAVELAPKVEKLSGEAAELLRDCKQVEALPKPQKDDKKKDDNKQDQKQQQDKKDSKPDEKKQDEKKQQQQDPAQQKADSAIRQVQDRQQQRQEKEKQMQRYLLRSAKVDKDW